MSESGLETSAVAINMDPRLLHKLDLHARGVTLEATNASGPDEVPVIAEVRDPAAWEARSDVRPGLVIAATDAATTIVTGRVPVERLSALKADPNVVEVSATQPVSADLREGVADIRVTPDLVAAGFTGEGVVVGIVDYGCDFAHTNFRNPDGSTRIEAIWNQAAYDDPMGRVRYGRIHERADIDTALRASDPYGALNYGPRKDIMGTSTGSHGTHVMDIAAGSGGGTRVPGVAPGATILFVEASANDVPWQGEGVVGRSLGDSAQLLEGLRWIFNRAGERPCVINVSLGTNGGPHDGTTLFERGIDSVIRERPNRAVVISAGNSYDDGIHASGTVTPGGSLDLRWSVTTSAQKHTQSEVEIWYPAAGRLAVELILPSGKSLGTIDPGTVGRVSDPDGTTAIYAASTLGAAGNGDNTIGIFLERGMFPGAWTIRLHNTGAGEVPLHAWIERNDAGQASFVSPRSQRYTLGSLACGHETIAVGSYDGHKASTPLSWFSSSGPTRDGRRKPEVSAPGHDVLAAWSRTGNAATRKSGTSMAAPMVTGAVAVLLSAARRAGRDLSSREIRELVTETARPMGSGWDERYGHGRLDLRAMLDRLLGPGAIAVMEGPAGD